MAVEAPQSWRDRLAVLASAGPGWLDGEGDPVTESALDRAAAILSGLEAAGMPRPGIFPTPSGGIQLEDLHGGPDGCGFEVEIPPDVDAPMVGFGCFDTAADTDVELTTTLEATRFLVRLIRGGASGLAPAHILSVPLSQL